MPLQPGLGRSVLVCIATPEQDRAIDSTSRPGSRSGPTRRWRRRTGGSSLPAQGEARASCSRPQGRDRGHPVEPASRCSTDDVDATHAELKSRGIDVTPRCRAWAIPSRRCSGCERIRPATRRWWSSSADDDSAGRDFARGAHRADGPSSTRTATGCRARCTMPMTHQETLLRAWRGAGRPARSQGAHRLGCTRSPRTFA